MTLTEQLNNKLKQIEALTAKPNYLSPDEKKAQEKDTPLIKQLKLGLKPETADKGTQTILSHQDITRMEEAERSINKFLWGKGGSNFIKNEDTKKDVAYKLSLI